jgi:hypothetical protein
MSGIFVVMLLLAVFFLPVAISILWFHFRRIKTGVVFYLVCCALSVISLILALSVQSIIPVIDTDSKWSELLRLFVHISLTEEGSKLLVLLALFSCIKIFCKQFRLYKGIIAAAGLIVGFTFAALEGAIYAASDGGINLVRLFTSVPLHGACGIKCGIAASKPSEVGSFIYALALHSFYDLMLPLGGLRSALAVFLAITALISGAQMIKQDDSNCSANQADA